MARKKNTPMVEETNTEQVNAPQMAQPKTELQQRAETLYVESAEEKEKKN